jgi:hypothetical protein
MPAITPESVSDTLAMHFINGMIRGWQPFTPGRTDTPVSWTAEMSNGQKIDLDSTAEAAAFCCGLASAHQAWRGFGRPRRGNACLECGSTGSVHAPLCDR